MEICRRPQSGIYDINQNSAGVMHNVMPASSGSFTLTFNNNQINNQINALHTQVSLSLRVHVMITFYSGQATFWVGGGEGDIACQKSFAWGPWGVKNTPCHAPRSKMMDLAMLHCDKVASVHFVHWQSFAVE